MKLIAEIIVWASRICFIGAISFAGIALVIAAVLQLMNNDGRLAFGIVAGILVIAITIGLVVGWAHAKTGRGIPFS